MCVCVCVYVLQMTVHYSSLMVFWEVGDVEGIMAVLKEDFNLPV